MICPTCGGRTSERTAIIEIRYMDPPPRQVEPYVRVTRWQCLVHPHHHGEREEPFGA